MSKKRDTFIFKKSWADALKKRSAAVQLEVYNAIVSYAVDGVIPEMSEIAEVVFDFIRIEIDENNAKYEEVIKKRREAGKRGMEIRYSKNEDANPAELPVLEEDSNNSNKKQQKVTKLTNAIKTNKCYQKVTNVTDSVNDNDSVNILTDIKKETISNEIVKKEGELLSFSSNEGSVIVVDEEDLIDDSVMVKKAVRVNYERIVGLYHKICVSLPMVSTLTDKRKEKVRQRFKELGEDYGKIEELFRKVQSSEFLTGANGRGWRADFDWIFKNGQNWLNIMEGKYVNHTGRVEKSQLQKNFEFMESIGVKQENIIF